MRNMSPLAAFVIASGMFTSHIHAQVSPAAVGPLERATQGMELSQAQAMKQQELDAVQRGQDGCKQYGFKPGTAAYAGCVQKEVWREKETAQALQLEEARANEVRRQQQEKLRMQEESRASELKRREAANAPDQQQRRTLLDKDVQACTTAFMKVPGTWADRTQQRTECLANPQARPRVTECVIRDAGVQSEMQCVSSDN